MGALSHHGERLPGLRNYLLDCLFIFSVIPQMGVSSLTTSKAKTAAKKSAKRVFLISKVKYIQNPELIKYGKAERKTDEK